MAALNPRALSLGEFRVLLAIAFVCHAVGLFVLPQMPFLFSQDIVQLMQYGGHGARISPSHPLIYAVYLLPFPAFVGLFFLQTWARYLLLLFFVMTAGGTFFLGASVSGLGSRRQESPLGPS